MGHRSRSLEKRVDGAEVAVDAALVHREQKILLAAEIEVDRAFGEPRFLRDVGNARGVFRRAQQQRFGGVEDRVVAFPLVVGLNGALADDH